MCSINGVVSLSAKEVPLSVVDAHASIARKLRYRGPDRIGLYKTATTALFVTQMDITLQNDNEQPVTSENRSIACCLNGEIFNYRELNLKLAQDFNIRNNSDNETFLRLYQKYGLNCFDHIRGMYAVAIADTSTNKFVLARDRFGEKPLFYSISDDLLHFCSESRYLIPFTGSGIDEAGVAEYLSMGFASDHIIKGISRLQSGTMLVCDNGSTTIKRHWSPRFPSASTVTPRDASIQATEILRKNIREMIPTEVDFGSYISGGLDSAIIASIVAEQSGRKLLFTSGLVDDAQFNKDVPVDEDYHYVETRGNELNYADILAKQMDADYHRAAFSPSDVIELLPDMIRHLPGGPVMSTSFPLFYFTARASSGTRVCFTGEGSDEINGGYSTSQPDRYTGSITRSFVQSSDYFSSTELEELLGENAHELMASVYQNHDQALDREFADFGGDVETSLFNKIRHFMLQTVFAPHLLEKADGMTMGKGPTELRMPFLCPDYVELAFSLPYEYFSRGDTRKVFVHDIARRVGVPSEIITRPSKQRTSLPYYNLFFHNAAFERFAMSTLDGNSIVSTLLNLRNPGQWVYDKRGQRNAHKRAWSLLVLELCLQDYFGH